METPGRWNIRTAILGAAVLALGLAVSAGVSNPRSVAAQGLQPDPKLKRVLPGFPLPDLTISVAIGPNPVTGGGPLLTTVTVKNVGNANATGVKVTNRLPSGAAFVKVQVSAYSGFSCTHVSGVVTCAGGAIPAGGLGVIYIDAKAPPTAGSLTFTTVVDPDNTIVEQSETNNTASVTATNIGPPDLLPIVSGASWVVFPDTTGVGVVDLLAGRKPTARGVTLHLSVKNQGTGLSPTTTLRIELLSSSVARFMGDEMCPPNTRFADGSCILHNLPAACGFSQNVATCSIPELAGGAVSGQFVANVSVTISAANLPITFYVRADADGAVTESNESNNIVPLTMTVP